MTKQAKWIRFFLAHPCDCDPKSPASERCNRSGWIRCNRRLREWRAHPDYPQEMLS